MELHKDITKLFVEYLMKHGYPEDSIVLEWGNNQFSVDIAIVDIKTKIPISLYEIKGINSLETRQNGVKQLQRISKYTNLSVSYNLVLPINNEPFFEVINCTDEVRNNSNNNTKQLRNKLVHNNDLSTINYNILSNSVDNTVKNINEDKIEKTQNGFKIVSWAIIPLIILVIIVLDSLNLYKITYERLIVYGVLILVILLPFVSEVKLGNENSYIKLFNTTNRNSKEKQK